MNKLACSSFGAIVLTACALDSPRESPTPLTAAQVARAAAVVDSKEVLRHTRVLAAEEFEGRAPGTPGEALSVDYIAAQFKALGLAPAQPHGSYFQQVSLVGFRSTLDVSLKQRTGSVALQAPRDIVAWAPRPQAEVTVADSDLVFVGYGVVAPEYGWDDYKGADLRGKTLVMLVNDPPIPDPADPRRLDDAMFKGRAMTYYGRWTYKYEIAAQMGAAAALIVHETIPAAYPYSVVANSFGRENLELADAQSAYPTITGWIPIEQAQAIFHAAGRDFETMKAQALRKDFKPVSLDATASFRVRNAVRRIPSRNVIAKIDGSDPLLRHEAVVYTAHWDHLGWDQTLPGPKRAQVYHGAIDNASGVAALLEVARAYRALPRAPRRSIVFIATTSEEQQQLGAKFYVNNPVFPLRRTLANINIDTVNAWGRTSDVGITGYGHSTLDELIVEAAAGQGRTPNPDPSPETGAFYRSDQLPFIREGVPAAWFGGGRQYIGKPADYSAGKRNHYRNRIYHKVTDVVDPEWDLSGAVEDVRLQFQVGLRVAESDAYPEWKAGSEFKAKRDAMMQRP